jgi:hypothetical protein
LLIGHCTLLILEWTLRGCASLRVDPLLDEPIEPCQMLGSSLKTTNPQRSSSDLNAQ